MAAGRVVYQGIGTDIKSNMAANRVLLFRSKIFRIWGKYSWDRLCAPRRFYSQNAASIANKGDEEKSQRKSDLSQTEEGALPCYM